MLGKLTIIRGRVGDLLSPEGTPQGGAPTTLTLDGRRVRLDDFPQGHTIAPREGDELIVAGHDEGEVVAACACRNVTQHYSERPSVTHDVFWGVVSLVVALIGAWASWTSGAEPPLLFWLQRLGFAGLGIVMALVSMIYFLSAIHKLRAEYLVNVAGLETIRGVAQKVEQILWADPARHFPRFTVAGRPVRFCVSRVLKIRDGDEVIVAGQPGSDAFVGIALRNVTQSVSERGWDRFNRLELFLVVLIGVVMPVGIVSSPSDYEFMIPVQFVVALAFWSVAAVAVLLRFYSWKLDQEAWRRVCAD